MDITDINSKLKEIEINYSEMKDSFLEIFNTNFSSISNRIIFYNNIFLLEDKFSLYKSEKTIPLSNEIDYNTYYTLLDSYSNYCRLDSDNMVELYDNSEYNIKNLIKKNYNLEDVIKVEDIKDKLANESSLLNLINEIKESGREICPTKNLDRLFNPTFSLKYMLFVKIIVKFLNPTIDDSKLTNENLPFLNPLDLHNDITDEEKKIIMNVIKLKLILLNKFKYSNLKSNAEMKKIGYYENNKELVEFWAAKIRASIMQFNEFLDSLEISDNHFDQKKIIHMIFGEYATRISNDWSVVFNILIGYNNMHFKYKYFKEYIDFEEDIFDTNFDVSLLDKFKRYFSPFYLNFSVSRTNYEYNNSFYFDRANVNFQLDSLFKTMITKKKNIFEEIIETNDLNKLKKLKLKLFLYKNETVKLSFDVVDYRHPIFINTNGTPDLSELFNKDDSELKCDKLLKKYESVLNISKQFYTNALYTPRIPPYFNDYYIKFSGYGSERGLKTGPTKQIMYNLSQLMNYIIKYNDKEDKIIFNTPIWVNDNKTLFYEFMTRYILIDLKYKISKFNFYFKYNMINTIILKLYNKDNYKESYSYKKLFGKFNQFLEIDNIRDLFYDKDGNARFEALEAQQSYAKSEEELEFYYFKICLFLIGDLLEGGAEYKYLLDESSRDYTLDPENEFLETKIDKFKMPDAFMSENAINLSIGIEPEGRKSNVHLNKIEQILIDTYFLINENSMITPEAFIGAIRFENNINPKYDVVFDYMKQLITDYEKDLPEEFISSIKEKYPTQESFNEKLLLVWSSSLNITQETKLQLIIDVQPSIIIQTCFNSLGFPVSRENSDISYEDFVNIILAAMTGIGFGRGGRKRTKKYKNKNKNRNKITHKKNIIQKKIIKYKKLLKTLKKKD